VSGSSSSSLWREGLEPALLDLEHIARALPAMTSVLDAETIAEDVRATYGLLLRAYDEASDPLADTRAAIERLLALRARLVGGGQERAVAGVLAATEHAGQATTHVCELLLDRLPPMPGSTPPEPPRLLASVGTPRLHVVPRAPLLPTITLPVVHVEVSQVPPAPIPRPKSFDELRAAVAELARRAEGRRDREPPVEVSTALLAGPKEPSLPAGFVRPDHAARTPEEFALDRLREGFEEIVALGLQRKPLETDTWRSIAVIERRLLNALDAVVALGPTALAQLEGLVVDFPIKDPWRLWAATFVLGSVQGRDSWLVAERLLRGMASVGPEIGAAFLSAGRLVPHRDLPRACRASLASRLPLVRATSVALLAARSALTVDELRAAAADVPVVADVALPYFALTREPDVKKTIAAHVTRAPAIAAVAMIHAGMADASDRMTALLGTPAGLAVAPFLGLLGREHDVALVEQSAQQTGEPVYVEALGWLGSVASVPTLLRWLDASDDVVKLAAASSLARITGQRPIVELAVAPEKIEAPAVAEAPGDKTPQRRLQDPRAAGANGSPDIVPQLSTERRLWETLWARIAPHFTPGVRYRRGFPHSPHVVWNELAEGPCTFAERRLLQLELVVTTGRWIPFDPDDFVATQELALAAWEPIARGASGRSGVWGSAAPAPGVYKVT
jgi:hypothetical protein